MYGGLPALQLPTSAFFLSSACDSPMAARRFFTDSLITSDRPKSATFSVSCAWWKIKFSGLMSLHHEVHPRK
jgi:hypothetical protein